jgi:hypothetical protein
MTEKDKDVELSEVHQPSVQKIATDIIEPALREALAKARKDGSAQEVVNALANCYGGLLVDLLGRKPAVALLRDHANHIASSEEVTLTN